MTTTGHAQFLYLVDRFLRHSLVGDHHVHLAAFNQIDGRIIRRAEGSKTLRLGVFAVGSTPLELALEAHGVNNADISAGIAHHLGRSSDKFHAADFYGIIGRGINVVVLAAPAQRQHTQQQQRRHEKCRDFLFSFFELQVLFPFIWSLFSYSPTLFCYPSVSCSAGSAACLAVALPPLPRKGSSPLTSAGSHFQHIIMC